MIQFKVLLALIYLQCSSASPADYGSSPTSEYIPLQMKNVYPFVIPVNTTYSFGSNGTSANNATSHHNEASTLDQSEYQPASPSTNNTEPVLPEFHRAKDFKIVGGMNATRHDAPWQVALLLRKDNTLLCGGTLLSTKVVVTAAHCFLNNHYGKNDIKVALGGIDNQNLAQEYNVKHLFKPAGYSFTTEFWKNDITVLILNGTVTLSSYIKPASLPNNANENYETKNVLTTGWGCLESNGPTIHHLQKATLRTWTRERCTEAYPEQTKYIICASYIGSQSYICQGDSGGPLIYSHNSHTNYLIGITSANNNTAALSIFTRTTNFLEWIRKAACCGNACLDSIDYPCPPLSGSSTGQPQLLLLILLPTFLLYSFLI